MLRWYLEVYPKGYVQWHGLRDLGCVGVLDNMLDRSDVRHDADGLVFLSRLDAEKARVRLGMTGFTMSGTWSTLLEKDPLREAMWRFAKLVQDAPRSTVPPHMYNGADTCVSVDVDVTQHDSDHLTLMAFLKDFKVYWSGVPKADPARFAVILSYEAVDDSLSATNIDVTSMPGFCEVCPSIGIASGSCFCIVFSGRAEALDAAHALSEADVLSEADIVGIPAAIPMWTRRPTPEETRLCGVHFETLMKTGRGRRLAEEQRARSVAAKAIVCRRRMISVVVVAVAVVSISIAVVATVLGIWKGQGEGRP